MSQFHSNGRRRARKIGNGRAANLMAFFRALSTVRRACEKQGKSGVSLGLKREVNRRGKLCTSTFNNLNKFLNMFIKMPNNA